MQDMLQYLITFILKNNKILLLYLQNKKFIGHQDVSIVSIVIIVLRISIIIVLGQALVLEKEIINILQFLQLYQIFYLLKWLLIQFYFIQINGKTRKLKIMKTH
ncbi:hypothetical protein IMG5_196090 [Ichthyophthirius multifiliis]|uniref:Transmembrane protein n=1 Tax=Ichthyophthirius multifiliis TaxID=5932 RepID=G0R525_ICHMU|nr:hypothetical protein IMG5_196090 [Ichthyophthirius multifiliis]EGR27427.1 hypothetical protein IMG5_196090 [Ichthyophthirius multifiliis]|eukprot:XP_004024337.1 hypothetical protein IMG5_196090 [Ichthyophthirius multifiliis]